LTSDYLLRTSCSMALSVCGGHFACLGGAVQRSGLSRPHGPERLRRPTISLPQQRASLAGNKVLRRVTLHRKSNETKCRTAPSCSLIDILPDETAVFNFVNVVPLPFWGAMLLAPRQEFTKKVMSSYATFVALGGIYLYLAYVSLSEPAILEGFSNSLDLTALTKAFSYEKTVAVGWAHFIAQDLFVGRWIYLDGLKNRTFTAHSLLLCLFFGPTGIISHVATRAITGAVRGEEPKDIIVEGSK